MSIELKNSIDPKSRYNSTSRYAAFLDTLEQNLETGMVVAGSLREIEFEPSADDDFYTTKLGDLMHLDNLAHKFYGDARYWWVIAFANAIVDPFMVEDAQMTLRIPSMATVQATIEAKRRRILD